MKVKWKVYKAGRHVDSGTIEAESDKEALGMVLLDMAERPGLVADDCYSVTAGEITTTSFGDEFKRSARVSAHGMDEDSPMDGDYHFQPSLKDIGIDPAAVGGDETVIYNGDHVDTDVSGDHMSVKDAMEAGRKLMEELAKKAKCLHNNIGTIIGTLGQICLDCGAPVNRPSTPPGLTTQGMDTIVGRAMNSAAPGDTVEVVFSPHFVIGGGVHKVIAGDQITIGEGIRIGASGHAYPPPKNKGDYIPGTKNLTGRALASNPNLQNMPVRTKRGDALRKAFQFNPPPLDAAGERAKHIFDKSVREVATQRQKFASIHGVTVDDVEVTFIHDEVQFSLKD